MTCSYDLVICSIDTTPWWEYPGRKKTHITKKTSIGILTCVYMVIIHDHSHIFHINGRILWQPEKNTSVTRLSSLLRFISRVVHTTDGPTWALEPKHHSFHSPEITFLGVSITIKNPSGWWFQPLLKILVSWDDYPIYEMENKKCSKPPTSHHFTCDGCTWTCTWTEHAKQNPGFAEKSLAFPIAVPFCSE